MPSRIDNSLGFVTNRLANRFKAELERGFVEQGYDITSEQGRVLVRLYEEDGLAQYEVAERIAKDKTNVARILALMERKGLVERRVDPEDNRSFKIWLTPLALSMKEDINGAGRAVLKRAQGAMSDEEVRHLIEVLNSVYENLG